MCPFFLMSISSSVNGGDSPGSAEWSSVNKVLFVEVPQPTGWTWEMSLLLDLWFTSSLLSSNVWTHFDTPTDTCEGRSFLSKEFEVESYLKHSPGYNCVRINAIIGP